MRPEYWTLNASPPRTSRNLPTRATPFPSLLLSLIPARSPLLRDSDNRPVRSLAPTDRPSSHYTASSTSCSLSTARTSTLPALISPSLASSLHTYTPPRQPPTTDLSLSRLASARHRLLCRYHDLTPTPAVPSFQLLIARRLSPLLRRSSLAADRTRVNSTAECS